MTDNSSIVESWWFVIVMAALFLCVFVCGMVSFIADFSRELRYVKSEIRRTSGKERKR